MARSSQRRRRRFTVTLANGGKQVLLAHDARQCRAYFKKLGKEVQAVQLGDYRDANRPKPTYSSEPFVAGVRTLTIGENKEGSYRLKRKQIIEVMDELGLILPVAMRLHGRRGPTHGSHLLSKTSEGNFYHNIMLKSYISAQEASLALLHELRHAHQAEDTGSEELWQVYSRYNDNYPYAWRPMEMDARDYALSKAEIDNGLYLAA